MKKNIVYVLATVSSILMLALLAELGLNLFSYGKPSKLFVRDTNSQSKQLVTNQQFTHICFPPERVRWPVETSFLKSKPDSVYRIFVVGESAAMGDPDHTYGFWRILEILLGNQYPGKTFEIINTSITAINSNILLPIVNECLEYDPDLFIIYAGNNEVIGPFGPSAVLTPYMSTLPAIRAFLFARSTKLGQLAYNTGAKITKREPKPWAGMQMFLDHKIYYTDERLSTVHSRFKTNILDMCKRIQKKKSRAFLCTVASDLVTCPPYLSLFDPQNTKDDSVAFVHAYATACSLYDSQEFELSVKHLKVASSIDSGYAEVDYLLGKSYMNLGDNELALKHLSAARDKDGLRLRTDTYQNKSLRQIAQETKLGNIKLVEIEKPINELALTDYKSSSLFYDHVHMNFDGNYHIARLLADKVAFEFGLTSDNAISAIEECKAQLAFTAYADQKILADIYTRYSSAPFTGQYTNRTDTLTLRQKRDSLKAVVDSLAFPHIEKKYVAAIKNRPTDPHLVKKYGEFMLSKGSVLQIREYMRTYRKKDRK